ncbi:MAG: sensor histidine kinase [Caldilineaceae bacterium]
MSSRWLHWATETPLWRQDLLLGMAVATMIALIISADQGGKYDADWLAYLYACGFGALMLIRRQFPLTMLVTTVVLFFSYYMLHYPVIGLAVPVSAALYSAAEQGQLGAALLVSLLLLSASTVYRYLQGQSLAYLLGYELTSSATLMAAAIALGEGTRTRRALRTEQAQTTRLIEQEHAYRAEYRIQAERLRIARDLHDVLGHHISVISLQADVAREALEKNQEKQQEEARQALIHIRNAASATMRELRTTVKLLRNPSHELDERVLASLTNLAALLENAKASGLTVNPRCEGNVEDLPATVDNAAFRIIQEAITNIMRHANATVISLRIEVDAKAVRLLIEDNGVHHLPVVKVGSGILGMQERARLLGGHCTAQPLADGGFAVQACLPLANGHGECP